MALDLNLEPHLDADQEPTQDLSQNLFLDLDSDRDP